MSYRQAAVCYATGSKSTGSGAPEGEAQRLHALLRGDRAAFEAVVTEYYGSMVRLARAMVGPDSADDVVQEAWIAVLKGLSRFEGRSTLKTWILGIVVNMARQRRRQDLRFALPPYQTS